MDALFKIVFCVALAVLLAGCLQSLSQGEYAANVSLGAVNASVQVNLTNLTLPDSFDPNSFVNRTIPNSLNVCLFDATVPDGYFGEIFIFNKPVVLRAKTLNHSSTATEFFDCSVIALFDTGEGEYFERLQREAVRTQVSRGAGLIVEKRAATLSRGDDSILGYAPLLDDLVPVRVDAPGNDARFLGEEETTGVVLQATGDGALDGTLPVQLAGRTNVTRVFVTRGEVVAFLRTGNSPTSASYPAIVRDAPLSHNAVYYYALPINRVEQPFVATVRTLAANYVTTYAFLRIGR